MISRSITLLSSLEKKQNKMSNISLIFSNNVLKKTPKLQRMHVFLSLFFKKRHESKDGRYIITHNKFLQKENRVQNFSAAFRNSINNLYSSVNNSEKNEQYFSQYLASKNYKFTFLAQNNMNLKVNKYSPETHDMQDVKVFHMHTNDAKTIQKNSLEESSQFITTQKLKYNISNSIKSKSSESNMNSFVYKTENVINERIKKIEKKIIFLDENSNKSSLIHDVHSLSEKQIIEQSYDLNDMSEKVYDFVMKRWEREQRRKGDLYA